MLSLKTVYYRRRVHEVGLKTRRRFRHSLSNREHHCLSWSATNGLIVCSQMSLSGRIVVVGHLRGGFVRRTELLIKIIIIIFIIILFTQELGPHRLNWKNVVLLFSSLNYNSFGCIFNKTSSRSWKT